MEPIAWDDRWLLGDERIDTDHRHLVTALNQLAELLERGAGPQPHQTLLDGIGLDLGEHCRHEHELMRRTLCPGTPAHDRQHQQLLDAFCRFRDAWEGGEPGFSDAFAAFRGLFLFHQNAGLDRELAEHCRTLGH